MNTEPFNSLFILAGRRAFASSLVSPCLGGFLLLLNEAMENAPPRHGDTKDEELKKERRRVTLRKQGKRQRARARWRLLFETAACRGSGEPGRGL